MPRKLPTSVLFIFMASFSFLGSYQALAQEEIIKFDGGDHFINSEQENPDMLGRFGTTLAYTHDWLIATGFNPTNFNDTLKLYFLKIIPETGEIVYRRQLIHTNLPPIQNQFESATADSFLFIGVKNETILDGFQITAMPQLLIYKLNQADNWVYYNTIDLPTAYPTDVDISAIASNKNTVVVGVARYSFDQNGENKVDQAGIVHVVSRNAANQWVYSQSITAPHRYIQDRFGTSVSLSQTKLAISAPWHDRDADNNILNSLAGKVYVYQTNDSGIWELEREVVSNDAQQYQQFGKAIDIYQNKLFSSRYTNNQFFKQGFTVIDLNTGEQDLISVYNNPVNATFYEITNINYRDGYVFLGIGNGSIPKVDEHNISNQIACAGLVYKWDSSGLQFQNALSISGIGIGARGQMVLTKNSIYFSDPYSSITNTGTFVNQTGIVGWFMISKCKPKYIDSNIVVCDEYTVPTGSQKFQNHAQFSDTFCDASNCITYLNANLKVYPTQHTSFDVYEYCEIYKSPSGKFFSRTGNYFDTIPTVHGCDSIMNIYYSNHIPDASIEYENGVLSTIETFYRHYRWINCITGDTIPNENTSTFTPKEPGLYTVEVFNEYCSAKAACFPVNEVDSSFLLTTDTLIVFPNPSQGRVNITFGEMQTGVRISVFDSHGRRTNAMRLKGEISSYELNLPEESGLYIIIIESHNLEPSVYKMVRN